MVRNAYIINVLLALLLAISRPLNAQNQWSPTRPNGESVDVSTPEQKQVEARRPGLKQSPATEVDKRASVQPASFETVASENFFPPHVDSGCDCAECNPLDHLGCTTPGCSCGSQLPGCGMWVSADYLLWSLEGMEFPALVTTSPIGTAPGETGVLGRATTRTLFGGDVEGDFRSGGRITAGIWTDPHRQVSWEGSYLGFEEQQTDFSISSSAFPNLARPVFDTLIDGESALLIAHSTFLTGSIAIDASTELQAFEVLRRQHLCSDGYINIDLLLGYKHGNLDEMLRINNASTYSVAQGPILAGTTINGFDQFETENNFNGFLIGLDRRHRWNGWLIGTTGKLSLGSNRSEVVIDGQTVTTVPAAGSATFNGGLLAQATNIGRYQQDEFMVIPELEFVLRRRLNECTRLHCGYSLMYWSGVTRATGALSRRVSQFPPEPVSGTADPSFQWNRTGFLAHGFQFGIDYKF